MAVTRGFSGRPARVHRLPPGQYDAGDQWPALQAEATLSIDVAYPRPAPTGPSAAA
jgi:hypothetical protein